MTDLLGMIVFNAVLFFSLLLSLPASALAQQEVDPTYFDPVPAQTVKAAPVVNTAKNEKAPKQMSKNQQHSKAHKHAGLNNAQQMMAKK